MTEPLVAVSNIAQGEHHAALSRPLLLEYVDTGQARHADDDDCAVSGLYRPAGHGVATPARQVLPAGQGTPAAVVEPLAHSAPS